MYKRRPLHIRGIALAETGGGGGGGGIAGNATRSTWLHRKDTGTALCIHYTTVLAQ